MKNGTVSIYANDQKGEKKYEQYKTHIHLVKPNPYCLREISAAAAAI